MHVSKSNLKLGIVNLGKNSGAGVRAKAVS
jgi:hypothetical protein